MKSSTSKTRTCIRCGKAKPPDQFYANQGNTCKECTKKATKSYRQNNPVKYRATRSAWEKDNPGRAKTRRKSRLKRRYNLNLVQLVAMLAEQDFKCPICHTPLTHPEDADPPTGATRLVVDHDHRDGHVRGLLCSACNVGLGQFNDDTKLLKKAREYLKADRKKFSSSRITTDVVLGE